MTTHVKFSETEEAQPFRFLSGMISNIIPQLIKIQKESVNKNDLKTLKCALVKLQEDAAKCEVLVNNGEAFLEKQNG